MKPAMKPVIAVMLVLSALAGCSKKLPASEPLTGGNAQTGQRLVAQYGCASCHQIKGIPNSNSKVGPSLLDVRETGYIGGVLPNSGDNMIKWIMHPSRYSPNTAMPDLGMTEAEARDMAAYLYSQ
jgi:cytochrome c2